MLKSRYSFIAFVLTTAVGLGGMAWLASAAEKPAAKRPVRAPRQLTLQPSAPALPEPATQPAPSVKIATVNMRLLFQSFKGTEALQKRAEAMNQEMMEAARTQNQAKMNQIRAEFQKLQQIAFDEMKGAVAFVAKREHIDVVVPIAGDEPFIYKNADHNIPDITRAALDRWNVATTMPSSAPASEPAPVQPAPKLNLTPSK